MLPCADSCFTLPSGRVHTHGRQMVLFVRKQKDCLPEQFYGGKERQEKGVEKPFCTVGRNRSWVNTFVRAEVSCSFQDPVLVCIEAMHERER